jgi:uncharacterized oligopeptide transporter (OPT) family protein
MTTPAAVHQPYVPASQSPPELTPRAITLGVLLGLIFGASNVYLALKIGLTVSASIPIAVLSITIFRALGRSTILENNIVQTTGSAADSVSAGVVFTIPAILLMGYDLDISRVTILPKAPPAPKCSSRGSGAASTPRRCSRPLPSRSPTSSS